MVTSFHTFEMQRIGIGRGLRPFPSAVPDVQVSKHPAPGFQLLLHLHRTTRAVFQVVFRHCLRFILGLDLMVLSIALLGLRLCTSFL